jgi:hypothetical protein
VIELFLNDVSGKNQAWYEKCWFGGEQPPKYDLVKARSILWPYCAAGDWLKVYERRSELNWAVMDD